MSKDEPLLSNCSLETAGPSRNYARVPGYEKKDKTDSRKEKKNERRRNPYARVRRYKIISTLRLLLSGDPQDEGLRRLQPRARLSKLDYFHAGITSTRLHRLTQKQCYNLNCWSEICRCSSIDCTTARLMGELSVPGFTSRDRTL